MKRKAALASLCTGFALLVAAMFQTVALAEEALNVQPSASAQQFTLSPKAGSGAVSLIRIGTKKPGDCSCRAFGSDYLVGETACLNGKMAKCGYSLNNTSWIMLKTPCPIS